MKLQIKKGGGIPYARKEPYEYDGTKYEADIKDGDTVTILDSGITEQGNYGEELNFKIKTRNGDKKLSLNQTTVNVLVQELGESTENWIGKDVRVILHKKVIANSKRIVPYLVVGEWFLDEYGELVKKGELPNTTEDSPF